MKLIITDIEDFHLKAEDLCAVKIRNLIERRLSDGVQNYKKRKFYRSGRSIMLREKGKRSAACLESILTRRWETKNSNT